MSNLAGKAYALTVISPQRFTWINRLIYALIRCRPAVLGKLHRLTIIHFARWVILPADRWPGTPAGWRTRHSYILFVSNFNNTWDAYLDAFSDILARGLDLLWYQGLGFPKSVPSAAFKSYIDHNTIDAGYYYSATPGHAVRDINNAFIIRKAIHLLEEQLDRIEADASLSESDRERLFRQDFHQVWRSLQNRLPTPGRAPVVSPEMGDLLEARRRQCESLESLSHPYGFLQRVNGSDAR